MYTQEWKTSILPEFIAVLLITAKVETIQCPTTDKETKKMRSIHTVETYSTGKNKRDEVLTHTTREINFENNCVKRKKAVKEHILCDSVYMKGAE